MLKKFVFMLFITFSFANTLNIDFASLEKYIKTHPFDVKNRLLLAKYYEDNKNYQKAKKLIEEVLLIDPKNKKALFLKKQIDKKLLTQKLIEKYGNLDKYIDKLYKEGKYKELLNFYTKYKPLLNKDSLIKIARVAMWEGKYDLSLNILNKIKEKNLDILEIQAYDYLYKGNILKANQLFKILYSATGNKEYGKKLLETYLQLGDSLNAKKVLYSLRYKLTKKEYQHYLNTITKSLYSYINKLKKQYSQNPTFENLKKLVIALYELNHKEAIKIAQNYVNKHPNDIKANIFLAKLYTWNGETQKASQILNKFINSDNYQAKLLYGKILAWNGLYKKAIIFLSDVYENGNPKQKYEALKMLGFIQMWQNHNKKAKEIFKKLQKLNPNDEEVKEALMILDGKIKPLINKYQKLVNKYPNKMDYILKLADLYYMVPNYKKAAKYYEIYLKNNPDKIEIYKILGDIYLQLKEYYKGFSYWEYYAALKNTPEAYLELAKRYYWNGFNKEALDILNKLISKYPKFKEAIELKAKILKVNPRFIYSENQTIIEKYFNNRSQKLLIYGDRSYFAGFYKTASNYYKEYLFINPSDDKVREKYAYSLEFEGDYKTAAGEFYNLLWEKKDPILEYHYAYCLQKIGKTKQAKEIYEKLLKEVPKPLPEKLKKFLENWKKAWESMDFERYSSFYDDNIKNNLYWRLKKQNIFKKAGFISVGIYDPVLIEQEGNIKKIKFYQVYASQIKKDKGYKTLWIKCENNKCKIIKEKWYPGEYNPNNPEKTLILLIKNRLKELQSKDYIKLQEAVKNIPKIILSNKNIKRETNETKIKQNLNIVNLKPVKVTPNKIITSTIEKKNKNYAILSFYHFHDNQETHYNHIEAKYLRNFNNIDLGVFLRFYKLKEKNKIDYGKIIAGVINYYPYKLTIGIDKANSSDLYFKFNTKFLRHNINILHENMVYSRKSICSLSKKRTKLEATRYIQLDKIRGLWYSLAAESINDGNIVFTPQVDYDFYGSKFYNNPYALFFSGWYQFNSKSTNCYYSPKKTDSNLIGIKFYPQNKILDLMLKAGIGYSFFDDAFLYKVSFKATKDLNLFNLNAKCEFSNTTPTRAPNNYQSYECFVDMEKSW